MVRNANDLRAMAQIGSDAAIQYVEANGYEARVMRWKLRIDIPVNVEDRAAQTTAIMYIWAAMSSYDLGKLCREWLAYGYELSAAAVLEACTGEDGQKPAPSLVGSEV